MSPFLHSRVACSPGLMSWSILNDRTLLGMEFSVEECECALCYVNVHISCRYYYVVLVVFMSWIEISLLVSSQNQCCLSWNNLVASASVEVIPSRARNVMRWGI